MNLALLDTLDWNKGGGLLPLVAQHAHDGRVLMLGYTNREALSLSLRVRQLHFWSRSKQRIWRKGETSGHVLAVVSVAADCDGDAILCQVVPVGPTCHRGTQSCFDGVGQVHPWLNELESLIGQRDGADPDSSYVARLLSKPAALRAQKVGEEGVEVAIACACDDRDGVRNEAADLLFHLLVLLRGASLRWSDVVGELAARHRGRDP